MGYFYAFLGGVLVTVLLAHVFQANILKYLQEKAEHNDPANWWKRGEANPDFTYDNAWIPDNNPPEFTYDEDY